MVARAGGGAGPGVEAKRVVACCLAAALLTTACAASAPRLTPPADLSATDREACEQLAGKAKAEVRGDSVLGGAAKGAAVGTLGSLYLLARSDSVSERGLNRSYRSSDSQDGLLIGALLGSFVAIGAIVAGGAALADNVSARDAAYADAMDACLRPAVLTREFGPEHPEVARSLRALGYRYYRQGELAKAEPLYVRALAIQEKALGAGDSELAGFLDDYAAVLGRTGREVEAEKLKQRARAIRVKR